MKLGRGHAILDFFHLFQYSHSVAPRCDLEILVPDLLFRARALVALFVGANAKMSSIKKSLWCVCLDHSNSHFGVHHLLLDWVVPRKSLHFKVEQLEAKDLKARDKIKLLWNEGKEPNIFDFLQFL